MSIFGYAVILGSTWEYALVYYFDFESYPLAILSH
jgi:hypothetical protein